MKKKSAYVFICILLFSQAALGQINTNLSSVSDNSQTALFNDTVVKFVNYTKLEEIIINIRKQTKVLELTINGAITSGKLNVAIISPKGTTLGEFEVKAKNNDKKETSLGEINKFLKEPEPVDWKVKISTVKATGNIKIKANFKNEYYINAQVNLHPMEMAKTISLI